VSSTWADVNSLVVCIKYACEMFGSIAPQPQHGIGNILGRHVVLQPTTHPHPFTEHLRTSNPTKQCRTCPFEVSDVCLILVAPHILELFLITYSKFQLESAPPPTYRQNLPHRGGLSSLAALRPSDTSVSSCLTIGCPFPPDLPINSTYLLLSASGTSPVTSFVPPIVFESQR